METRKYNGWTNYETWAIALWIDNSEGDQDYWNEQAEQAVLNAKAGEVFTAEEEARYSLANEMKDHFEAGKDDLLEQAKQQCSVWADLLGAALSEVDWREIAQHYIDEALANQIDAEEV